MVRPMLDRITGEQIYKTKNRLKTEISQKKTWTMKTCVCQGQVSIESHDVKSTGEPTSCAFELSHSSYLLSWFLKIAVVILSYGSVLLCDIIPMWMSINIYPYWWNYSTTQSTIDSLVWYLKVIVYYFAVVCGASFSCRLHLVPTTLQTYS